MGNFPLFRSHGPKKVFRILATYLFLSLSNSSLKQPIKPGAIYGPSMLLVSYGGLSIFLFSFFFLFYFAGVLNQMLELYILIVIKHISNHPIQASSVNHDMHAFLF